jgi:hypothetical protein
MIPAFAETTPIRSAKVGEDITDAEAGKAVQPTEVPS